MQFSIAGVTHDGRQEILRWLLDHQEENSCKPYGSILLLPEPMNPHDENAIAVYARAVGPDWENEQLGYVPAKLTDRIHGMMRARECEARLVGLGPMKRKPKVISARVQVRRQPVRRQPLRGVYE
jgi:hypothetical protein